MRVEFIGDPSETDGMSRRELSLFGVTFRLGQAEDVSHLGGREKGLLAKHSHFSVLDSIASAEAPSAESAAVEGDDEAAEAAAHKARAAAKRAAKEAKA